jgi:hypothetical protein
VDFSHIFRRIKADFAAFLAGLVLQGMHLLHLHKCFSGFAGLVPVPGHPGDNHGFFYDYLRIHLSTSPMFFLI